MSNEYKQEFDEMMSAEDFEKWAIRNLNIFVANIKPLKGDASLKWWVTTFLLWSEYEDNKDIRRQSELQLYN